MSQIIIIVCLLIASIIHLLPLSGILGSSQLTTLYGVAISDPNLLLLMRHRAILFGLLGLALLSAAFAPQLRTIVIAIGLISTISFVLLALFNQPYNHQVSNVIKADILAIVMLLIAAILHLLQSNAGSAPTPL